MDDYQNLLDGYARFRTTTFAENREIYRELAKYGQSPKTMVIACCDSRADPVTVFGAGPGALFVVRNVANLVPPYEPHGDYHGTSAALEFAITGLHVRNVVVMGHAQCGGIQAFLEGTYDRVSSGMFIGKWMSIMKSARGIALRKEKDPPGAQRALEQAAIGISLDNLLTFPFVRDGLRARTLALHGTYFDIASGTLHSYDQDQRSFHPVEALGASARITTGD